IGNPVVTPGATTFPAVTGNNVLVNPNDVGPELGILGTPVIDPGTNILYLETNSQEFRDGSTPSLTGADRHFVQRLWAINIADGSVAIAPTNPAIEPATGGQVIGDVIKSDAISSST